MPRRPGDLREVLYEFRAAGQQYRVAAIDPDTGIEVVIIAPITASQAEMKSIALAKLRRRIAQQYGE